MDEGPQIPCDFLTERLGSKGLKGSNFKGTWVCLAQALALVRV